MDFTQRGPQVSHQGQVSNQPVNGGSSRRRRGGSVWLKYGAFALLLGCTVILVALLYSLVINAPAHEDQYVKKNELQAVFLNGGQVYFGNVKTLNDKYLRLNNIYYLRVNQTVQPNQSSNSANNNDVSLVKLGCELHGPEDQMVINRDQIIFWENLKSDGQVAKAVKTFVEQNPKGQNCAQTNSSSNSSNTPASGQ